MGLGDIVEKALSKIGVTEERVQTWLGRPCGCRRRKEKLNQLGQWAARILTGKTVEKDAADNLDTMIDDGIKTETKTEPPQPEPPSEPPRS